METVTKTPKMIEDELNGFCGTERYYGVSPFSNLQITDGVKYLCDNCKSYWILDIILSYQNKCNKDEMLRKMQFWTLKKAGCNIDLEHPLYKKIKALKDNEAIVYCERDTNDVFLFQVIPYTDFPLAEIKLWVENEVICLPQER